MVSMGKETLLQFSQITVRIHSLYHGRDGVPINFSSSQNFCDRVDLSAAVLNQTKKSPEPYVFKDEQTKQKRHGKMLLCPEKKKSFPLTLNHSRADRIKAQALR